MATVPAATGISGTAISRLAKARVSSQSANPTATATRARKVAFRVNRVTTASAPSPTLTATATGRLRPVRVVCGWLTGPSLPGGEPAVVLA
jgi:hypothetical protein